MIALGEAIVSGDYLDLPLSVSVTILFVINVIARRVVDCAVLGAEVLTVVISLGAVLGICVVLLSIVLKGGECVCSIVEPVVDCSVLIADVMTVVIAGAVLAICSVLLAMVLAGGD